MACYLWSTPFLPPADTSKYFSGRILPDMLPNIEIVIADYKIREGLFFVPDYKALGPDEYASLFFKKS